MPPRIDLTERVFGKLTVKSFSHMGNGGHSVWNCECECGGFKAVSRRALILGEVKSCGCLKSKYDDLIGQTFGYWTVKSLVRTDKGGRKYWECQCQCGRTDCICGYSLVYGSSTGCRSCGVIKRHATGLSARNNVLNEYKRGAKERDLEWSISLEEFLFLTAQDCYYCGRKPSTISKKATGNFVYNGLDRADNSLGYTKTNTVPCCQDCNMAKRAHTIDEFKRWIQRAYLHIFVDNEYQTCKNGLSQEYFHAS